MNRSRLVIHFLSDLMIQHISPKFYYFILMLEDKNKVFVLNFFLKVTFSPGCTQENKNLTYSGGKVP